MSDSMENFLNTFFKICVYFCLILIIFNFSLTIVNSWNIFVTAESGVQYEGSTAGGIFESITGLSGGAGFVWAALVTATGLAALILVKISQSASVLGVWLLSTVYWTSYHGAITVLNMNNWIPNNILLTITLGLLFIWMAAIIGILTGSG